jgi:hypothetical protein
VADEHETKDTSGMKLLQRRVEELQGESARRKNDLRTIYRALGVQNRTEAESLVRDIQSHGDVRKVLKEYQTLKSSPDEVRAENEKLRGELRGIKHRTGFEGLYQDKELGLNPAVSPERLMGILGYTADADEFNASAVRARVLKLKESDPYLFGGAGQAGSNGNGNGNGQAQSQAPAPAWLGRGSAAPAEAPLELSVDQMRDPVYMLQGPGASLGLAK